MLPPRDYIAAQNAALSAARRLRDRQREGSHLSAIGFAYSNLGKYPEAFESYKEALRIADEVNDRENRIFALSGLGFTCNYLGNFQEAVNFHTKALEMVKDDKEQLRQQGISLAGLGKNYSSATWPEKNYPQAINYFKQALDIARQTEDRQSEISVLGDLGSAYASIGNYQESITNFNLALKAARAIGDRQNEYTSMGNLGLTFLAKYRYQEAVDLFDQALIIARDELSNPLGEGANLDNLAMAYAGLSNLEKAIELSEKSVAIFKSIQSQYNAAASRTLEILREAENQGRAQVNFEEFG
jgi:tetratricopeptide (TPR) repeat protein